MAKLKIEELIDHLESEIRKSLDATMRAHFPEQEFTSRTVYKTFKKEIQNRCNTWEKIPNKYVRPE